MTIQEISNKSTTAFNAHDLGGFAELIADDAVLRAPGGISRVGKQSCVTFFSGWLSGFPDARITVRELCVCDDVAVERGTLAGIHDGVLRSPAGDIQPTGSQVTIGYVQAIRFRDGKQAAFHLIYDRLELLEQHGLGLE